MGNTPSTQVYDQKKDPCSTHLESYLLCVEGKKNGLKEGDECHSESEAYKACRRLHRKKSNTLTSEE